MQNTSKPNSNVIPFPTKKVAVKSGPELPATNFPQPKLLISKSTYISIFLLLALGLVWGSGYAIARFAMTNGVPPLGYAFWQSLGPAIITYLFTIKEKQHAPKFKHWKYYLICGLVGLTIPNTLMYFVAPHVPAGSLAVIVNTVPIFIFPLALIFQQEVFNWKRLVAVIVGIVGILLLVLPSQGGMNVQFSWWLIAALISPLCFALCAIYIASKPSQPGSALTAACGMLIISTLFLMPITAASHSFYPLSLPFNSAEWVIILEILLSSIGYVLFFHLLRRAGSVYYSMVGGVVGITGLFWGWVIFNERPSMIMWGGVVFILLAIMGLSVFRRK